MSVNSFLYSRRDTFSLSLSLSGPTAAWPISTRHNIMEQLHNSFPVWLGCTLPFQRLRMSQQTQPPGVTKFPRPNFIVGFTELSTSFGIFPQSSTSAKVQFLGHAVSTSGAGTDADEARRKVHGNLIVAVENKIPWYMWIHDTCSSVEWKEGGVWSMDRSKFPIKSDDTKRTMKWER